MRKISVGFVAAATLLAVIPAMSQAGGIPLVATKKVLVKDNADPAKYLVKIVVKDPSFDPAAVEPTAGEGFQHFAIGSVDRDEVSTIVAMPMSNWTAKGAGYAYSDKAGAFGPVLKIKLGVGKIVMVAKGPGFDFPLIGAEESGTMAYHFYGGTHNLCGAVPGMDGAVKKDDPVKGIYVGVNGEAPAFCPAIVVFD